MNTDYLPLFCGPVVFFWTHWLLFLKNFRFFLLQFEDCSSASPVMLCSRSLNIFVYYLMCDHFQWLGTCSYELWHGEMKSLAVDDKDKKRSRNWPKIVIGNQNSFSVFNFQWAYLILILNKIKPSDKVSIDMLADVMWFQCFHSKSNVRCELFQTVCFQIAYIIKFKYC